MHPAIEVIPEKALIHVRLKGEVDGAELVAINAEVSEQQHCQYQIWEFVDILSITVSPDEMHTLARQDWACALRSGLKKVALVGASEDLQDVLEFYELYSEQWVGRPNKFLSEHFTTLDEAFAWIESSSDSDPDSDSKSQPDPESQS